MSLTEKYVNRLKSLAGLSGKIIPNSIIRKGIIESITLTANNNAGRSDSDTLSWFVEQYILKLGGDILAQLDEVIKSNKNSKLILSKNSTKINANTLVMSVMIEKIGQDGRKQEEEFMLTLSVNIDTDSNTVASVTYKSITDKFNLSSKHSDEDLERFKSEIVEAIINSVAIIEKAKMA